MNRRHFIAALCAVAAAGRMTFQPSLTADAFRLETVMQTLQEVVMQAWVDRMRRAFLRDAGFTYTEPQDPDPTLAAYYRQ